MIKWDELDIGHRDVPVTKRDGTQLVDSDGNPVVIRVHPYGITHITSVAQGLSDVLWSVVKACPSLQKAIVASQVEEEEPDWRGMIERDNMPAENVAKMREKWQEDRDFFKKLRNLPPEEIVKAVGDSFPVLGGRMLEVVNACCDEDIADPRCPMWVQRDVMIAWWELSNLGKDLPEWWIHLRSMYEGWVGGPSASDQ